LDLAGLTLKILNASAAIDFGRKGFAARGKAEEGRISYETGIAWALSTFRDAQSVNDPHAIILIEYTFLNQELQFCDETDTDTINSLKQAILRFVACSSHCTRLKNILRSPGIDSIEKNLLKQRYANLAAAQKGYIEKQKKALTAKEK